jgi:hypothetical protein
VVEIEMASFSREMNRHTIACCAYKAERHCAHQVSSFLTLAFQYFTPPFTMRCTAPTSHSIVGEADKILHATDEPIVNESKSDSGTESDSPAASTSSNAATAKITDKTIPDISDYWKKLTITEAHSQAYHSAGWLTDDLESSVSEVDVQTVDGSIMVCFEPHLVVGLGLPPSKFLVAIMNFLGCELVHFNLNTIAALSCFTMMCEC